MEDLYKSIDPMYEDRARPLMVFDGLIKEIIGDQGWKDKAACKGMDVSLFFPERGKNPNLARTTCRSCEVRKECVEFAIINEEQHGVWGGLALRDRRKVMKGDLAIDDM